MAEKYEESKWCSIYGGPIINQDFENGFMVWDGRQVTVHIKNQWDKQNGLNIASRWCIPIPSEEPNFPETPKLTLNNTNSEEIRLN